MERFFRSAQGPLTGRVACAGFDIILSTLYPTFILKLALSQQGAVI